MPDDRYFPQPSIEELIGASSLGSPEAVAARARVSDAQVADVMARYRALADDDADDDEWFCGCCGRESIDVTAPSSEGGLWCPECAGHVLPGGTAIFGCGPHPWDRTWFAQHGTGCPVSSPRG